MSSSSRALASYANARLDDAPLCQLKLQLGVERWCCLLCRRQFRSARHIGRHLERSALHRDHLATARLHGRVSGALPATAAARGAPSSSPLVAAAPGPAGGGALPPEAPLEAAVAKPMSALEQMELFEKRLKKQGKSEPKKMSEMEEAMIDSNKARTINNQMDWECGQCGQFNFARSVSCHSCHHHVDKDTKYLSNRLKELKHERFSRVFGGSEQLSRAGLEAGAREQAVTAENNLGGAMLQGMGWRGGGLGRDEGGTTEAPRGRGARHFGQ